MEKQGPKWPAAQAGRLLLYDEIRLTVSRTQQKRCVQFGTGWFQVLCHQKAFRIWDDEANRLRLFEWIETATAGFQLPLTFP